MGTKLNTTNFSQWCLSYLRIIFLCFLFFISFGSRANNADSGYRYMRLTALGGVSTYDIYIYEIEWLVGSTSYPITKKTSGTASTVTATIESGNAWIAFDGVRNSGLWTPNVTSYPYSITCDLGSGVSINPSGVKISIEWNARALSSFTCEGSNDNSSWTNLYTKSGLTESDWVRDATNNFLFPVPDVQAPTVPGSLSFSNIYQSGFTLSWTASSDNIGVASYEVFSGTKSYGTTTSTSLKISGLTASTAYSMIVIAKDAAGNTSPASESIEVTTSEYIPGLNGFLEDFNDNTLTNWYLGSYGLTEANQMLKINPVKSDVWAGFGFSFPQIDITNNPYVSLKIKSNFDFNISLAIGTKDGKIDNYPLKFNVILVGGAQEVVASDEFQEYSFDYTGIPATALQTASNLHFVLNPLTQEFGSAPNKEIYFDDIKVGEQAAHTPAIATIQDQLFTVQTSVAASRTVNFRNVNDGSTGTNAISIKATSSNTSCIPDPKVTYTSAAKTGSLVLYPNVSAAGQSMISVVVSAPNTTDKVMTFKVKVLPNAAPSMKLIPDLLTRKGEKVIIRLDQINDGNSESTQNITITGVCSNTTIIPEVTVQHDSTDFNGKLSFEVAANAPAGSQETVSVTLKDNGGTASGGVDTGVSTFKVFVYDDLNNIPTLDSIPPKSVKAFAGTNQIELSGISDGDNKNQTLSFVVSASANNIVSNLSVGPVSNGTASLNYTLTGNTGTATITVTATDNGGATGNNGNQSVTRSFVLTSVASAVTGIAADYKPFVGNVAASGVTTTITRNGAVEILADGTVHITGTVMPQTWPANWFSLSQLTGGKELDMSANKLVSFQFKGASTMKIEAPGTPKKLDKTRIYFRLIDNIDPSGDASSPSGYNISFHMIEIENDDAWHQVYLDFNGKFYKDAAGKQTDSTRITRLMLDINTQWFPQIGVDCYFKDIKLGDKADKQLPTPRATINNIPNQTVAKGDVAKSILMTGISDGSGNLAARLTATTNKPSLISNLQIGPVANGTALLSYTLNAGVADSASIMVIAKNIAVETAIPDTASFKVYVVDSQAMSNNMVTIDLTKTFQTVAGVGCFINGNSDEQIQAIKDLNITVLRCTSNGEFEPVNDNSDPNVTDYSKFNLKAIPTDAIRNINENTNCHKFFYTIWTPANWMKQNKAEFPSSAAQFAGNNKLKPEMYEEFAEYVVAICKTVKEEAGVELYAISLQNEPTFNEPYSSCQYTGAEFRELVKVVGPRMKAENLSTRIMLSEDVNANNWVQANVAATNDDATARKYLGILACHLYDPDGVRVGGAGAAGWTSLLNFKKTTLAEGLWMTETSGYSNIWEGYWGKDYLSGNPQFFPGPLDFAASIYTSFKSGNISGWVDLNNPVEKLNDELLGGVFKNYSAFINPEAVMVNATASGSNILSLAFKNADNSLAVVLLNKSHLPLKVKVQGSNVPAFYRSFITQNYSSFAKGATVTDGSILLPARSITTLYHSVNNAEPAIDQLGNLDIALPDGEKSITLTGINYGADIDQQSVIEVTATSGNTSTAKVSVTYNTNTSLAELKITPLTLGSSVITVKVKDDGGIANGGVDTTQVSFTVNVKTLVGISEVIKSELYLYPNPTNSEIALKNISPEGSCSVMIMNINGQILKQIRSYDGGMINVEDLDAGIYIVRIVQKNNILNTLRFIKQ